MLQSLYKALPSTTVHYKACTKYFPILLCTSKLAQSMSQYYFVLQSLHRALPSTFLYYKACTKHFPVVLCTTKLAQTTSQYYFVLQSAICQGAPSSCWRNASNSDSPSWNSELLLEFQFAFTSFTSSAWMLSYALLDASSVGAPVDDS